MSSTGVDVAAREPENASDSRPSDEKKLDREDPISREERSLISSSSGDHTRRRLKSRHIQLIGRG